jgi:murein DD-endopeptidase MepM/ murein hydrolase activator NlpD
MKVTRSTWDPQCGNLVEAVSGPRTYRFCHLDKVLVRRDQKLKEGARIGTMGETGFAFGRHLHFIMYNKGKLIDGDAYIREEILEKKYRGAIKNLKARIKKKDVVIKKLRKIVEEQGSQKVKDAVDKVEDEPKKKSVVQTLQDVIKRLTKRRKNNGKANKSK